MDAWMVWCSVEVDGVILEKPDGEQEAVDMISQLSGRTHLVHSGVAIYCQNDHHIPAMAFAETTQVRGGEKEVKRAASSPYTTGDQ